MGAVILGAMAKPRFPSPLIRPDEPISGTRLIREYQGVEHCVTVRDEDFEYQGRPFKSLSAIARSE